MFIETEATPNPATLKFLPGRSVLPGGTLDIRDETAAAKSPLAQALFGVPGVSAVFFGDDFISVTKANGDWQEIKPAVLGTIMEHFVSGAPILVEGALADPHTEAEEFFEPEDAATVTMIKELIDTRVRPSVASDGGDIKFRGFREGTVYLAMKGSCSGCPSSSATLKLGIQNLLRHYVPSVHSVEEI